MSKRIKKTEGKGNLLARLDPKVRSYVAGLMGRMAAGIPKKLTEEERERRRVWMREVNQKKKDAREMAARAELAKKSFLENVPASEIERLQAECAARVMAMDAGL